MQEMKLVLATVLPRMRLRLVSTDPLRITLRSFFFGPKGGSRVFIEGAR